MHAMARAHVAPLGATPDVEGNYILTIGDSPTILWSAHLDTVHNHGGMQRVTANAKEIFTLPSRRGHLPNCLGADDGVGVWLLINMVRAGVAGRYVWHVGEECGSRGSRYIDKHSDALAGIQIAMAFDRRGTADVITHQFGERTASDAFATSFAVALARTGIDGVDKYAPEHGVFTDTANYADSVAECSNLSCGYFKEHSVNEHVSIAHVLALRDALCLLDTSSLVIERKPGECDDAMGDDWETYWYRRSSRSEAKRAAFMDGNISTDDSTVWIDDVDTGEAHCLRSDWERSAKVLCGLQVEDGEFWTHDDGWLPRAFCASCLDIEEEQQEERESHYMLRSNYGG